MARKRAVSLMAAIALAAAPTIASAAAAPLPAAAPIRASASADDSNALEGGNWTLLLGVAIVAAVLVIALTGNDDNVLPDVPTSP